MKTKYVFTLVFYSLFFIVLISCKEEDCGCDSKTKKSLSSYEGRYLRSGNSSFLGNSNSLVYAICNDEVIPKNIKSLFDSLLYDSLNPNVWVVVDGEIGVFCIDAYGDKESETITIASIKLKDENK